MKEISTEDNTVESPSEQKDNSFARAAVAVFFIMLGVKLLGFVEKQVLAYYFGASEGVDALFIAIGAAMNVQLLVMGVVGPSFLPVYAGFLESSQLGRARRLFFHSTGVLLLSVPAICIFGIVYAAPLSKMLAPGFSPSVLALTESMLRFTLAGAIFMSLGALTYSALNAHRRFAFPALGDLIYRSVPILFALLLAGRAGPLVFAVGVLFGAVARYGIHLLGYMKFIRKAREKLLANQTDLQQVAVLAAPLIFGAVVAQIVLLADNYFSTKAGPGEVAARIYAVKIIDFPTALVPQVLSIVVFPYFVTLAAKGNIEALNRLLFDSLRGLAIPFAFLTIATIFLARPIVALLLERGAFDAAATSLTVAPLRWYGLAFVPVAIEPILTAFFYAKKAPRIPVFVGIVSSILGVFLDSVLVGPLGISGIALADGINRVARIVTLAWLLPRVGAKFSMFNLTSAVVRLLIACAATFAVLVGLDFIMPAHDNTLQRIFYLGMLSTASFVTFILVLSVVGREERTLMQKMVRRILEAVSAKLLPVRAK